jgi:twinkle protein
MSDDPIRAAELIANSEMAACSPMDFSGLLGRLWEQGMPSGDKTGWPSVDNLYTVVPGQLTILTGWPGSGKSEWLDALLLNLAKQGWKFAIFSPENQPTEIHVAKFIEKYLCKPFGAGPTARASLSEVSDALAAMDGWFSFLCASSDTERTNFGIEEILAAAEAHFRLSGAWKNRDAKHGLVIDPWNEIEHLRPKDLSETEYVSQTLTRVRAWARAARIHVWIVAHPQKLRRDDNGKLPIPRPDSISGSQHWWNKADNAITVWRALDDPDNQKVEIHVQKVRFKHVGRVGVTDLRYDRVTGRYHEMLREVGIADYYKPKTVDM